MQEYEAALMIQKHWRMHAKRQTFFITLADVLVVQSVARRWIAKRLVIPYMKEQQMNNSDCVIVDDYDYRRNKEEQHTMQVLSRSVDQMEETDVLSLWKKRDRRPVRTNTAAVMESNDRAGKGEFQVLKDKQGNE